jgi:hypothetical protein
MLSIASEENLVLTKIAFLVQVYQSNTELWRNYSNSVVFYQIKVTCCLIFIYYSASKSKLLQVKWWN